MRAFRSTTRLRPKIRHAIQQPSGLESKPPSNRRRSGRILSRRPKAARATGPPVPAALTPSSAAAMERKWPRSRRRDPTADGDSAPPAASRLTAAARTWTLLAPTTLEAAVPMRLLSCPERLQLRRHYHRRCLAIPVAASRSRRSWTCGSLQSRPFQRPTPSLCAFQPPLLPPPPPMTWCRSLASSRNAQRALTWP